MIIIIRVWHDCGREIDQIGGKLCAKNLPARLINGPLRRGGRETLRGIPHSHIASLIPTAFLRAQFTQTVFQASLNLFERTSRGVNAIRDV